MSILDYDAAEDLVSGDSTLTPNQRREGMRRLLEAQASKAVEDALRPLVECVREWQEARKAVRTYEFGHAYALGGDPEGERLMFVRAEAEAALSALALPEEK